MKTLAVSNYKGGVGKTTTTVNLAHVFAGEGMRVLLVDLDPQASATDFFGLYDHAQNEGCSSIDLLYGHASVEDSAFRTTYKNIDVVPSIIELVDQNELLLHEQTLKFALDDAAKDYDIAIIDCSPVMKRLAFNAYVAASNDGMVIIPVKLDSSVMRGIAPTINAMRSVTDSLRLPMPKWKILRTFGSGQLGSNKNRNSAVLDSHFPDKQFETAIHSSAKIIESLSLGRFVEDAYSGDIAAEEYRSLAKEVLNELS